MKEFIMTHTLQRIITNTILAITFTFTTASAANIDIQPLSNYSIPIAPAKATMSQNTIKSNQLKQSQVEISPIQITSTENSATAIESSQELTDYNTPSSYDGHLKNFPLRTVTLVIPTALKHQSTAAFGKYLSDSIANVLKYPYYNTTILNTHVPLPQLTSVDLAQIATEQQSDIVIMPVPLQDVYVQRPMHFINPMYFDDSDYMYIQANVSALIYYYDTSERVVHTIRSRFSQTDDVLTMPTHESIWNKVSKTLLDKLPYKRIPTDHDRYQSPTINTKKSEATDFQVEQPKNTRYSLQGVSVL